MATTMFFEGPIRDQEDKDRTIDLEFGRSSFYGGLSRIYINVGDKGVILSEKDGLELYESMKSLAVYLGYEKD